MANPRATQLEEELRNMTLGNVALPGSHITSGTTPRGSGQQHGGERGRGRGRGGTSRGRRPAGGAVFAQHEYQMNSLSMPNGGRGGGRRTTRVARPPPFVQNIPRVPENPLAQNEYLEQLACREIPKAEISMDELEGKEMFRRELESVLQRAVAENYSGDDISGISLVGFGSIASGFATVGSDIDLALVPNWKNPKRSPESSIALEIPRILEKAVLDVNMGGRLLTRTRVPILKVCQLPTETLAKALLEERQKWDDLPEEEKYAPPQPLPEKPTLDVGVDSLSEQPRLTSDDFPSLADARQDLEMTPNKTSKSEANRKATNESAAGNNKQQQSRTNKPFRREKTLGPLDFPKTGVGIQCDINFGNPLGIHNTRLLRCYSLCDPRVRLMVIFVKAWAKRRKINSAYAGTLSSYGWVLMVLHYLVNVAQPPVCPNLQTMWRPPPDLNAQSLQQMIQETTVAGYTVRFYDNEPEIIRASRAGTLTSNRQCLGALLRGFFQYYASPPHGHGPRPRSFYWTNEVISLRTPGGICSKIDKGWTGAKTTVSNGREVRNRYLFCIEDPFELDHNVARTVTHFGIVAIRDEFRRAWRILSAIGKSQQPEGGLFDEIIEPPDSSIPEPKPRIRANQDIAHLQSPELRYANAGIS